MRADSSPFSIQVLSSGGLPDTSIVPSPGRTVWNPGIYEGIPGDSATGRADGVGAAIQHGTTLPAGSSAATIQAALDAAAAVATRASRRFVKLGAGVFSLNGPLVMRDYVALRGTMNANGHTRDTILRNTVDHWMGVVTFGDQFPGSQGEWGTIRNVTVDVAHGDATVTVNDASNFNVGDIIQFDTLRDSASNATTLQDFGTPPVVYDPPNDGNWCWNGDGWWFMRQISGTDGISAWPNSPNGARVIHEAHEILAKNGNVLTVYAPSAAVIKGSPFRSPLYRSPEAYHCRGVQSDVRRYAGLEDLKIEPNTTNGHTAIVMNCAAFCWVKNVEIHGNNPNTSFAGAVWMHVGGQAYRCEITDCYFHGFDSYGPGGAYGIRMQGSDIYIHNNVLREASKPIMLEHCGGGNVIAYNYVDEVYLQNGWPELGIGTHLSFVHYALFEGNWTPCMGCDTTHGINGWITMFRNYARGISTSYGNDPEPPIRGVNVGGWSRAMYSIGNVLIDPALADNCAMQIEDPAPGYPGSLNGGYVSPTSIASPYLIGWAPVLISDGSGGYVRSGNADEWDDGTAGRNFHRHLDYDAFTDSQYDNSSNSVKTLPSSLHRSTPPDYFTSGGHAWPWVDPGAGTHATRVKTLPAKARYDAGRA